MRKPLSLNLPGMLPTSNQTKGATAEVFRSKTNVSRCCEMVAWKKKINEVKVESSSLFYVANMKCTAYNFGSITAKVIYSMHCVRSWKKNTWKFTEGCGKSPNCNLKSGVEICGLQRFRRTFHRKLRALELCIFSSGSHQKRHTSAAGLVILMTCSGSVGSWLWNQPWHPPFGPMRRPYSPESSQPGISRSYPTRAGALNASLIKSLY